MLRLSPEEGEDLITKERPDDALIQIRRGLPHPKGALARDCFKNVLNSVTSLTEWDQPSEHRSIEEHHQKEHERLMIEELSCNRR